MRPSHQPHISISTVALNGCGNCWMTFVAATWGREDVTRHIVCTLWYKLQWETTVMILAVVIQLRFKPETFWCFSLLNETVILTSQLVSSFIVTNRAREKCWSSETEVRKQKQKYGNRSRDAREKQPIWVSALLTYDRVLRPWSQRMTLSQQCESRISWDLGLQRASLLQCLTWLLRQCGQRSIRWVGELCQGQSQLF